MNVVNSSKIRLQTLAKMAFLHVFLKKIKKKYQRRRQTVYYKRKLLITNMLFSRIKKNFLRTRRMITC
jgi:hypothetical protein